MAFIMIGTLKIYNGSPQLMQEYIRVLKTIIVGRAAEEFKKIGQFVIKAPVYRSK